MKKNAKLSLIGFLIGLTNGIFGAGGGMIFIIVKKKIFGIEGKKAHATANAIILPLCIVSAIIMIKNYEMDYFMILIISVGGIVGAMIGAKYLDKISSSKLKKIFSIFIIMAAIKMII